MHACSLFPLDSYCRIFIKMYVCCYTRFFLYKTGYINSVPKSVRRPSVHACIRSYVRTAVMSLVNASPPKPLDVATANFAGA